MRKIDCFEKNFFMNFSRTVSKNLRPVCCCSTFPTEKSCDKPFFWRKKQIVFGFLWKFFFRFSAGSFCQARRNCILGVERYTFLEKVCLWKKQTVFLSSDLQHFSVTLRFFLDSFTKFAFYVYMGTFWRKNVFLFDNFLFTRSRNLTGQFLNFHTNTFCQFGQNCIRSIQTYELIKIKYFTKQRNIPPICGLEWKVFWPVSEKIQHFCQICARLSQLRFEEIFFLKLE